MRVSDFGEQLINSLNEATQDIESRPSPTMRISHSALFKLLMAAPAEALSFEEIENTVVPLKMWTHRQEISIKEKFPEHFI